MAVAILFLAACAIPILDPQASPAWKWISWVTWAVFAVDYGGRLIVADDRKRFFLRHPFDLLVIVLPLLRPLRLLRLATLLGFLNRKALTGVRGRVAIYVAGGSVLLAFCGALAVLDAERQNPDANITSFADALWWATATMTTVGYGDRYPTTGTGRLAAVALMMGGITILGVVTGTLASWLIEHVSQSEQGQTDELKVEINLLHAKLDRLTRAIDHAEAHRHSSPSPGLKQNFGDGEVGSGANV